MVRREAIEKKVITQAGAWYTYEGEKAMGLNGIKSLFIDNPKKFEALQKAVL